MYALDEIAAEAGSFREAYESGRGFRPLYVKIKLLYEEKAREKSRQRFAKPDGTTTR